MVTLTLYFGKLTLVYIVQDWQTAIRAMGAAEEKAASDSWRIQFASIL